MQRSLTISSFYSHSKLTAQQFTHTSYHHSYFPFVRTLHVMYTHITHNEKDREANGVASRNSLRWCVCVRIKFVSIQNMCIYTQQIHIRCIDACVLFNSCYHLKSNINSIKRVRERFRARERENTRSHSFRTYPHI